MECIYVKEEIIDETKFGSHSVTNIGDEEENVKEEIYIEEFETYLKKEIFDRESINGDEFMKEGLKFLSEESYKQDSEKKSEMMNLLQLCIIFET